MTLKSDAHFNYWNRLAGIGDQIVSSGTNFLAALVASRVLLPADFGVVVLLFGAATVVIVLQRAFVGDVVLARVSALSSRVRRREQSSALKTAMWMGVILGLACATVVFIFVDDQETSALLVLLCLPFLLAQDALRYVFFSESAHLRALGLDAIWLILMVAGFALMRLERTTGTVSAVFAVWAIAGALSGLIGIQWFGTRNVLAGNASTWLRTTYKTSGWFGGQSLLGQTQTQVVNVLLAALLGSVSIGALRAAQLVLLLPIQTLMLSVQSLLIPEMARAASSGAYGELRRSTKRLAVIFGIVGFAVATSAYIFRIELFSLAFGYAYIQYSYLVSPIAIASMFLMIRTPFTSGTRALLNARGTFTTQLAYSVVTIPLCVVGALSWGLIGAAWALAVGTFLLVVASYAVYESSLRRAFPRVATNRISGGD